MRKPRKLRMAAEPIVGRYVGTVNFPEVHYLSELEAWRSHFWAMFFLAIVFMIVVTIMAIALVAI